MNSVFILISMVFLKKKKQNKTGSGFGKHILRLSFLKAVQMSSRTWEFATLLNAV